MPWEEYERKEMSNALTATMFAAFDTENKVVFIGDGFTNLNDFLNTRASTLKPDHLEKMKVARLNVSGDELARLLMKGTTEMSGAAGSDVILLNGGWFVRPEEKAWAHFVPPVSVAKAA